MKSGDGVSLKTEFSDSSDEENNQEIKSDISSRPPNSLKFQRSHSLPTSFEYQAYELIFTTIHTLHW